MQTRSVKFRLSIELAIERIEKIGNDDYKEYIILSSYIEKIKDRINNNK